MCTARCPRDEIKKEILRFRMAVSKTRTEISQTREKVLKVLGQIARRFDRRAYPHFGRRAVHQRHRKKIQQQLMNAEAALVEVLNAIGPNLR